MDILNGYSEKMVLFENISRHAGWNNPQFGERVARRFADVGYEEFLVLPQGKMVSMLSGTITAIPTDDEASLFIVPSVERLVFWCEEMGGKVSSIERVDLRDWCVRLVNKADSLIVIQDRDLLFALSLACFKAFCLGELKTKTQSISGNPLSKKSGRGLRLVST
jgi:hypothetical protein